MVKIKKSIGRFNILLINPEISLKATQLIEKYKLSHNLGIPDALIAATTIYAKLKLCTFNVKDYKFIDGLEIYNP